MTPGTSRLILACVAIVAGAGAAAYVLSNRHPPPSTPTTQATPAALPAPGQPAPASAPPEPAQAPALQFHASVQAFSLTRDSAAYNAPSRDAPQFYALKAGTGLVSASRSADDAWVIALTQDGQAAYIPTDDLGAYDAAKMPRPPHVQGTAQVIDTATLTVDGQSVTLFGLTGKTGDPAQQMQGLIDAQGSSLDCRPSGAGYVCTLPDGTDIARAALFNGGAATNAEASADYRAQEQAARTARRGIWQ